MSRQITVFGLKAERRRARYHWAAAQGLTAKAARNCETVAGLLRAFPDRDIPVELIGHLQRAHGPRTLKSHQRSVRYQELRALGADAIMASEGSLSDASAERIKAELRGERDPV